MYLYLGNIVKPYPHLSLALACGFLQLWGGAYLLHILTIPDWAFIPSIVTGAISLFGGISNIGWALQRVIDEKDR